MSLAGGRKVAFGILGCGAIATSAVGPALRWAKNARLLAVGSRELPVAKKKAALLQAERAHGSYQALLEDPEIEAVYLGLPNGLHQEWALKAAQAGKHVLCEKSLTLSAKSAAAIGAAFTERRLRLVEGFMYRHHPQWAMVRGMLAAGQIGEVNLLRAGLLGNLDDPDNHRWTSDLGGGALYDVTCYGVDAARFLLGAEPLRVSGIADLRTPDEVDLSSQLLLEFPKSVLAMVEGSLRSEGGQHLSISGSDGRIEVQKPFIPSWDAATISLQRGGTSETLTVSGANHFLHQVEHFASLVLDPAMALAPAEDGLANAKVLEAAARSFRMRRAVEIAR